MTSPGSAGCAPDDDDAEAMEDGGLMTQGTEERRGGPLNDA